MNDKPNKPTNDHRPKCPRLKTAKDLDEEEAQAEIRMLKVLMRKRRAQAEKFARELGLCGV